MKSLRAALEKGLRAAVDPIINWMVRERVHPNTLSTLGFLITCSSGYFFHTHQVRPAGAMILLGGIFDLFDGTVARRTGLASPFGAFYDSTLDRISEIVVFLGLLSLYNRYGRELADVWMVYALFLAMGGSLMVSYTRARAEGLGLELDEISQWYECLPAPRDLPTPMGTIAKGTRMAQLPIIEAISATL